MTDNLGNATWCKSSRSESNGQCVEVAFLPNHSVGVRDSKAPSGPALVFSPDEWDAFTANVIHGGFDTQA